MSRASLTLTFWRGCPAARISIAKIPNLYNYVPGPVARPGLLQKIPNLYNYVSGPVARPGLLQKPCCDILQHVRLSVLPQVQHFLLILFLTHISFLSNTVSAEGLSMKLKLSGFNLSWPGGGGGSDHTHPTTKNLMCLSILWCWGILLSN